MKRQIFPVLGLLTLTLTLSAQADPAGCKGCQNGKKQACFVATEIPEGTEPPGEISAGQRDELAALQEEERLAFDIYNKLGEKYPLNPFKNIPRSEANHMQATASLLAYHGIPKPEPLEAGSYHSPALQKLYDRLVKRGLKSEVDALRVGALVEEIDIRDLRLMAQNPPSDIAANLSRQLELASYNHLRAFVRNLSARGVEYRPRILEAEEFSKIIAGEALDKLPRKEEAQPGGKGARGGKAERRKKRAQATKRRGRT